MSLNLYFSTLAMVRGSQLDHKVAQAPFEQKCAENSTHHASTDEQNQEFVSPGSSPAVDTSVTAWLQVVGGFLIMFNTWGIALSYGVFQAYYENSSFITATPSSIAWIGSTQTALLLLVGGLCGRVFDAGYLRHLLVAGWFLIGFGLMMTSLGHVYWQLFLSQSICVGVGMGCLLVPSFATVGTWFVKHRGTAFGIVSSGGAVGGIVLPIMLQRLLDEVGFPWTLRVLGFISITTLALSGLLLRQRLPPRVQGPLFEWTALKEQDYTLFTIGYFMVSMGFYVFPQFVQSVSYPLLCLILCSAMQEEAGILI